MKKRNLIIIALMSFSTIANASPYSKAIRHEEGIKSDYREIYDGVWSTDNIDNKNFNSNKSGEEIYAGVWRKEVVENTKKQENNKTNELETNIINRGNINGNNKITKENKNDSKPNKNESKPNNKQQENKSNINNIDNDDILSILN